SLTRIAQWQSGEQVRPGASSIPMATLALRISTMVALGHLSPSRAPDSHVCTLGQLPNLLRCRDLLPGANYGTHALQQNTALLDHLVCTRKHQRRDRDFECPGSLKVDDQLELGRLLDWQFGRIGTIENLTDKSRYLAMHANVIDAVGHKPAGFNIGFEGEHGRYMLRDRERSNMRCALREMSAR